MARQKRRSVDDIALELLRHHCMEDGRPRVPAAGDGAGPPVPGIEDIFLSRGKVAKPLRHMLPALKEAESRGELASANHESWFMAGGPFQVAFRLAVEPVFWGDIYFDLRRMAGALPGLLRHLPDGVVGTVSRNRETLRNRLSFMSPTAVHLGDVVREPQGLTLGRVAYVGSELQLASFNREGFESVDQEYSSAFGSPAPAGGG